MFDALLYRFNKGEFKGFATVGLGEFKPTLVPILRKSTS
jgi:hypothetical protein